MKKISIYVENARLTPSSYYRLTQYFQPSEARFHSALPDGIYHWWHNYGKTGGIAYSIFLYMFYVFRTLAFLVEDCLSMKGGTVILARAIVPRRLPALHKCLIRKLAKRNKIVWDFDDNILANKRISPTDFHFHSRYSDSIVVTSDFLKSLIDPTFAGKVKILPTTDGDLLGYDTEALLSQRLLLYAREVRLIWVGTSIGLEYILPTVPLLDDAARALKEQNGKKLSLHIVCNKPLVAQTSCLELVNICWERKIAKSEIAHSHIGLMPLPDTEFTRGKGGFKLIQYMSSAIPVVASAVGFNKQIVTNEVGFLVDNSNGEGENWQSAILKLASDSDYYISLSRNARKRYDACFSFNVNKQFWKEMTTGKTN